MKSNFHPIRVVLLWLFSWSAIANGISRNRFNVGQEDYDFVSVIYIQHTSHPYCSIIAYKMCIGMQIFHFMRRPIVD